MKAASRCPRGWGRALVSFVVTDVCAIAAWVYFFVLNRTTVVRPYRGSARSNLVFAANHQAPLDSFLIAVAAWFPRLLWTPALHPWSLAAAEYWYDGPVVSWLARHLRCIPIHRDRGNASALNRLSKALSGGGTTILFPEGRRSPDGRIRPGRAGVGHVACRTHAHVVPVALDGMLDAMPYANPRPRIGRRIRIAFGDPLECSDIYAGPGGRSGARAITDRAMSAVRALKADLSREVAGRSRIEPAGRPLHGKVVWITGASSGIGRSLALQAADAGATLILSARRKEKLRRVAEECAGRSEGAAAHVVPLDLTDEIQIRRAVTDVTDLTGRVDWVIHNAGIAARDLAVDLPLEVDRRVMETNYFAPVALTKAIVPSMLRRRSGAIVVVSSLTGKYGVPRMSAYAASKHALHGFFDSLRSEVREHGVRVTLAVPGFVDTRITVKALTGNGDQYGKRMSVHAHGMQPDECARRILRGAIAGKEEILVGGIEIFTVRLLRVSRRLVSAFIRCHPHRRYVAIRKALGAATVLGFPRLPPERASETLQVVSQGQQVGGGMP